MREYCSALRSGSGVLFLTQSMPMAAKFSSAFRTKCSIALILVCSTGKVTPVQENGAANHLSEHSKRIPTERSEMLCSMLRACTEEVSGYRRRWRRQLTVRAKLHTSPDRFPHKMVKQFIGRSVCPAKSVHSSPLPTMAYTCDEGQGRDCEKLHLETAGCRGRMGLSYEGAASLNQLPEVLDFYPCFSESEFWGPGVERAICITYCP
jgi:hypothetical protein